MAKRRSKTALGHWRVFSEGLITSPPMAFASNRKIFTNKSFEVPWEEFTPILPNIDLRTFGYAGWPAKEKQLDRNYFNLEELTKLNTIMKKRAGKGQSCVTARFGGPVQKGEDSMGYCMQTISLNYITKGVNGKPTRVVEVHYRATELLKKFVADMIYLQEKVLPIVLDGLPEPTAIRFHFQTIDVNHLYVNIICQQMDLERIYRTLVERGDKWARIVRYCVLRMLTDGQGMQAYATLRKQFDSFKQFYQPHLTGDDIRNLCKLLELDYAEVTAKAGNRPVDLLDEIPF